MSLSEIMPSVRGLSAADKLHLIRVLASDIDDGDNVQPLVHGQTYQLATPEFEPGAAAALMKELESSRSV